MGRGIIQAMSARPFSHRLFAAVLLAGTVAGCAKAPSPPAAAGAVEVLTTIDPGRLVDMSYPFDDQTIYWPTARPFHLTHDFNGKTPAGFFYASNSLTASEHGGTHLDAPYHFSESGLTTERIPPERLIARAVVIDVRAACASDPDHAVTVDEIKAFEAGHGAVPVGSIAILFTGWSSRWPDKKRYLGDDTPGDASRLHFPGLSAEAATYLASERKVTGVGIDTASIDPGRSADFRAHQVLGGANVYNLENLANVDRLPPTGAVLIALPMKIAGGTGGPVRVLAVLP
jgi:kynurenine formamidase